MANHLHDRSNSIDIAMHFNEAKCTDATRYEKSELDDLKVAISAIANAASAARAAYWTLCEIEGRAVEPASLNAPEGLLDEAYKNALQVEAVAKQQKLRWQEARMTVHETSVTQP